MKKTLMILIPLLLIMIIGFPLFKDYSELTTITIPSSVTKIGINPFIGCSKLTNIVFETNEYFKYEQGMILTKDSKELISYIHINKTETSFIFLSDELTTIKESAFEGNSYLQMIVIPMNVTKIEKNAFKDCTKLQHV